MLTEGSLKSKSAATQMNHSRQPNIIFSMTVYTKKNTDGGENILTIGKLHLVNLAGNDHLEKFSCQWWWWRCWQIFAGIQKCHHVAGKTWFQVLNEPELISSFKKNWSF